MPKKLTADDINARNKELWSKPGPHARQAALARKYARQTAAATVAKIAIGAESRARVLGAAQKLLRTQPHMSRNAVAAEICNACDLSVHQTIEHLKRLGIFRRR